MVVARDVMIMASPLPPTTASPSFRLVPPDAVALRRGQLALLVQEILTAATRARTGRQVPHDADSFRRDLKAMVLSADDESRRAGYASADVKYALYAVVAYVDETVLTAGLGPAALDTWTMRPLQDEIFGKQVAGEAFFQYLAQLLARDDAEDVADVLEVYLLCLLLGFRGRYATGGQDALDALIVRTHERIARIRGPAGDLSPQWLPDQTTASRTRRDPWLRRLGVAAAALTVVWLVGLLLFTVLLHAGIPTITTRPGLGS
jgi:type VI secretion system protein ImpK